MGDVRGRCETGRKHNAHQKHVRHTDMALTVNDKTSRQDARVREAAIASSGRRVLSVAVLRAVDVRIECSARLTVSERGDI